MVVIVRLCKLVGCVLLFVAWMVTAPFCVLVATPIAAFIYIASGDDVRAVDVFAAMSGWIFWLAERWER